MVHRNKYNNVKVGGYDSKKEKKRAATLSLMQKIPLPKYYKNKLFTEEEKELLWIEKIEEGYSYVMGEKHPTRTEEEEKAVCGVNCNARVIPNSSIFDP